MHGSTVNISPNFGTAADDYARHRQGFPEELYQRLEARGIVAPGGIALDVGTGTGTVARSLAARGLTVTALDPSPELLAKADELAVREGLSLRTVRATAEETGLAGESFDAVFAAQCFHWFDGPRAAREMHRILRPGGRVVVVHNDWLNRPGSASLLTRDLFDATGVEWPRAALVGHLGFYPQWTVPLEAAGFVELESFSFDVEVPYTHEGWIGRIRASAGMRIMTEVQRSAFEGTLTRALAERFEPVLLVPHRVFVLFGRKVPS